MNSNIKNTAAALALLLVCSPMLYAWAGGKRSAAPQADSAFVPVPIQGVNHTAEPVRFVLTDPGNKENNGGGETIDAYSAGGTMCCYRLPSRWRKGIKIEVTEIYRPPNQANADLPKVEKKHVLEVPRYAGGEVGELWVTRERTGVVSIVSSNFQPDHPSYPGKVKGWPVPDLAHQRKLYDRYIHDAQLTLNLFAQSLEGLNTDPKGHVKEAWDFSLEYDAEALKPFHGPNDPAYIAMLRKNYTDELALAKDALAKLKAGRP